MQLYIPKLNTKYLLLFDIEYDQSSLVQIAFLLFERKQQYYKLITSYNNYIQQNKPLNPFFIKYTNITDEFLTLHGLPLVEVQAQIDEIMREIDYSDTTVISHGLKNDLQLLWNNGINWENITTHYCTYNNAKKLLQRQTALTVKDIAADAGYYMFNEHNAYADVWGTLHVLCYLKEIENENT